MSTIKGADSAVIMPAQDIYEVSAIQKHRLGTRLLRGDRVFRYVKAGGTLDPDVVAYNANLQLITYAASPLAYPAGSNQVSITVASGDGPAADGVLAAHYMEGGYLVCFSNTVATFTAQILDNTAVASGGGTSILTLDCEVPVAIGTSTTFFEAMPSPYVNVQSGNSGGNYPFVGVPMVALSTTYPYGWIQTWGPTWVAPQAAVGATANYNTFVIRHDGSIDVPVYNSAYTMYSQHGGHVLTRSAAGTQGAPFVFLEIAP